MKVPFHRALLWLYVEQHDDHHIGQQLDEISLPLPEPELLTEYKEQAAALPLSPSAQKRIALKRYDEGDHKLLEKLGFEESYLKTVESQERMTGLPSAWAEVTKMLRNPVCRIAIDVGLLCKYNLEDLSQMIPPVFQEAMSERGIELYAKYFFDTRTLMKSDWRQYLKMCATIPYLYVRYHAALTRTKKEAMFLAGLPSKPAFTDFLKGVMATAEYKFEYYSRHNNTASDAQARHWAKVGFDAGVRFERYSSNDVTDFSKAVQTEFEHFNNEIPTIETDMLSEIKPPDQKTGEELKAPTEPVLFPDLEP